MKACRRRMGDIASGRRRRQTGRALTAALVALLTGVCLVGLWATYALRNAYEREADGRAQAEACLAARRLAAAVDPATGFSAALPPPSPPPNFSVAAALYDVSGRRTATAYGGPAAQGLPLPDRLAVGPGGEDAERTSRLPGGEWLAVVPVRAAAGAPPGKLAVVVRHRTVRLSTMVIRLVYELPLWLAVAAAGFWLVSYVVAPTRSLPGPADGRTPTPAASVEAVMAGYQTVIDRLQSAGRELERLRSDAETRAVTQAQFSDRLVASIPDALIVTAADGTVILANLAAQQLFGRSSGVDYRTFFADAPELAAMIADGLADGGVRRKAEMEVTLNGHRRTLDVSVSPIPGAASVLCLAANITELAALRATMRAKETLSGVGELAAGVAHEFKNALATIDGYARLLAQDAPQSPAAAALRAEVRRLTQVVSDFLTFARPTRITFAPVNLSQTASEVAAGLSAVAAQRGATLDIARDLPTVPGDAALLRQALENLLRNALEAVPENAPIKRVTLRAETSPTETTLIVEDSGGGLPPEVAANLFVPFFTTKKQGHGLGLAIVRKIVVGHNGRIEACNLPAGGAQFRVSLPLQPLSEDVR